MNCERFQLDLEELLYGELAPGRSAELRAHLAGCDECRRFESDLAREMELFSRYQAASEIEPSPEMWEKIRERIGAEGRERGSEGARERWGIGGLLGWLWQPMVLRQVAGALALIVVTVGVTVYFVGRRDEGDLRAVTQPTATPSVIPTATPAATPAGIVAPSPLMAENKSSTAKPVKARPMSDEEMIRVQVARAEREYVGAIRLLDRAIARRKGQIDGGIYAQYESSLALIDDSIEKSRRAMREHPGDTAAGQFMLAAYARKVELMQEIALQ